MRTDVPRGFAFRHVVVSPRSDAIEAVDVVAVREDPEPLFRIGLLLPDDVEADAAHLVAAHLCLESFLHLFLLEFHTILKNTSVGAM